MTATFPAVNSDITFVKLRLDRRTAAILEEASGRLLEMGATSLLEKVSRGRHRRLQAPGVTVIGIHGPNMRQHASALKGLQRVGQALTLRFAEVNIFPAAASPRVNGSVLHVAIDPTPELMAFKHQVARTAAAEGLEVFDPHAEGWQPHCSLAVIPKGVDVEGAKDQVETRLADRGFFLPLERPTQGLYVQSTSSPQILTVGSDLRL